MGGGALITDCHLQQLGVELNLVDWLHALVFGIFCTFFVVIFWHPTTCNNLFSVSTSCGPSWGMAVALVVSEGGICFPSSMYFSFFIFTIFSSAMQRAPSSIPPPVDNVLMCRWLTDVSKIIESHRWVGGAGCWPGPPCRDFPGPQTPPGGCPRSPTPSLHSGRPWPPKLGTGRIWPQGQPSPSLD